MWRSCLRRSSLSIAAVAACFALSGCAAEIRNHGYAPVQEELAQIRVGQDTRGSVRRKVGRPVSSGIFTDEGWYYVSTQIEHYTYNEPKVIDRRVVAITFDAQDRVAAVNEYGLEDGKIIDLETNTTPTYGRELTILEQAFSNVGANITESIGGN
jgi:outer membrane protein assembly factor BamE (lipoprotein component of BamABCDE complex)